MDLKLSEENWMTEVKTSGLSPGVVASFSKGFMAYMRGVAGSPVIPPMIFERDLRAMGEEIESISIDGKPIVLFLDIIQETETSIRQFRLRFQQVAISEASSSSEQAQLGEMVTNCRELVARLDVTDRTVNEDQS